VDAKPHPIQLYGETKLAGEEALRSVESASAQGQRIVLRVPLLYGPVRIASDSAVNILWEIVRDQSGKQYKMGGFIFPYIFIALQATGCVC
jgi:S-adenosylmethionine synthetase